MSDNAPKVLVEFSPEELSWLADRLHEMRNQWIAAQILGATITSDKVEAIKKQIEDHKKMETTLRNRLIDKAYDQGFGHL